MDAYTQGVFSYSTPDQFLLRSLENEIQSLVNAIKHHTVHRDRAMSEVADHSSNLGQAERMLGQLKAAHRDLSGERAK